MILKLQQGVWPELPNVHIWDYARWVRCTCCGQGLPACTPASRAVPLGDRLNPVAPLYSSVYGAWLPLCSHSTR